MSNRVIHGHIDGEFFGFDEDAVYKMNDGLFWHQMQYSYWYHFEYCPEATISYDSGRYYLSVAEHSIQVEPLIDVIESQIDGEFQGWGNKKRYQLTNGQIWEQIGNENQYSYSFRSPVQIYNINGTYVMNVNGIKAKVKRKK